MVGVGQRFARDKDGKTYTVSSDMTYAEWKQKFVDNSAESGIINTDMFHTKDDPMREVIPESFARDNSCPNNFTEEFVKLLKEV